MAICLVCMHETTHPSIHRHGAGAGAGGGGASLLMVLVLVQVLTKMMQPLLH